tara:strand:+ start:2914 stop:3672 length:759 start_codon:yes stop_codon:yes gene_type:complete
MKNLIIFDVDGTIVESSKIINKEHASIIKRLKKKDEIALCGGGTLSKMLKQMNDLVYFDHYFSECGCVYHKNTSLKEDSQELSEIYVKNLRHHELYLDINSLIKTFLGEMSKVFYELSGHFVDLRNGIVYLSCIGLQATENERKKFISFDKEHNVRINILKVLKDKAIELNIEKKVHINFGGTCGIGVYPCEYDKLQILNVIDKSKYNKIIYFGDKYLPDGNDYNIINHKNIEGHKIDNVAETYSILKSYLK